MIATVVWGLLIISWLERPPDVSDLRIQVEVFDWHSKKPPPKGILTVPKNAKPTNSFGVQVTPGKPFAAEVMMASRKFQLGGIVQREVEKAHIVTVRIFLDNSRHKGSNGISTTTKISLNEPTILGGSTSKSTRRGADYYTHRIVRAKIVREVVVE